METKAVEKLLRTPLYPLHCEQGGKMVPFAGWEMPIEYEGILKEHDRVRKDGVGLFDVSHMGEIEIQGINALKFCQKMTTNNVAALKPGKVQYSAILNEAGGIIDDCTVYCLNSNAYLLVVNASGRDKVREWLLKHQEEGVVIEDKSDDFALIALQGKKSADILTRLLQRELSTVQYYEFIWAKLCDSAVLISRTGYTGEDGFELYVPTNKAVDIWQALLKEGVKENISPIGLGARDTLRLEMGYLLSGTDFTEKTTALEANLSWIVKFDKGNFMGRMALMNQKETGPKKKIKALLLEERGIPRSGYEVWSSDQKNRLGTITSGTFSPTLKQGIAFAMLDASLKIGDPVQVRLRENKYATAKIIKPPFVDGSVKK